MPMFVGLSFRVSRAGRSRNNTLPESLLTKHRNHNFVQIVLLLSSLAHVVSFSGSLLKLVDLSAGFLCQSQVRFEHFTRNQAPESDKEVVIGQSGELS
jgi:methyl coenzyme M reductase subunit C